MREPLGELSQLIKVKVDNGRWRGFIYIAASAGQQV